MPSLNQLSTAQLRQALQLSEEIDKMQRQLESLLGGSSTELLSAPAKTGKPGRPAKVGGGRGGKRTMSAEGRAKIAAAARARWAKVRASKGSSGAVAKAPKVAKAKAVTKKAATGKGRNLTPEGRAKLAAAMKARWAARKKGSGA